jgi:hypothetical protein
MENNTFKIGDEVTLNGKQYTITGTIARSFILTRDGKQYKATADKLSKIQNQNSQPKAPTNKADSDLAALQHSIDYRKIFNPTAHLPSTEAEIFEEFSRLTNELSPENISCDGECSRSQIAARRASINAQWRALETILGRKVTENDVYNRLG